MKRIEDLEQYDIPDSVKNILAMEAMMSDRNQLFQKLFAQREENFNTNPALANAEETSI